jgi:6-pyruvoyltetrahydropterin/6-carboxytetrahydropterin synthase
MSSKMECLRLVRRYKFSAAHRYWRDEWPAERNQSTFGACANEPGHGHNYRFWITVEGPVDAETGFVVDLGALDRLVTTAVLEQVDHRSLNQAIERFREREIPSSENLALWIRDQLRDRLPGPARLVGVRVLEDEDLGAEWTVA